MQFAPSFGNRGDQMRTRLSAVALLLLASCATVPPYQAPQGAPTSNLVLERRNTNLMVLGFFANGANCTEPRPFPNPSGFWSGEPVPLESGKEFAFRLAGQDVGITTIGTCAPMLVSFRAAPGASYKLQYTTDKERKQCSVAVIRRGSDGRELLEPSFRRRMEIAGAAPGAPACEP